MRDRILRGRKPPTENPRQAYPPFVSYLDALGV